MSAAEIRDEVERLSKEIGEIQQIDSNSSDLTEYAKTNSIEKYHELSPIGSFKERTSDFPKDSNDYKARLHDIAWSIRNDIAFVGQANDLVISDGNSGYWKAIVKLPSMALSVTFSPNGNLVSTACLDATNSCRIYDVNKVCNDQNNENDEKSDYSALEDSLTKTLRTIDHTEGMVISHPFLSNEEILSATKNVIFLWDIEKSNATEIFDDQNTNGHSNKTEISTLATMHQNSDNSKNNSLSKSLFLSGDDAGCIKLWDIRESNANKCAMTWYANNYFETEISCIEFFPNNECFFAGSKDGSLRLFDVRTNYKQLNTYKSYYQRKENKNIPVTAVKLSQSGRFLFAGYDDTDDEQLNWNLVECIEIVTGKSCKQFRHESVVPAIALSPDGHSLVTACWNGKIRKFSSA